MHHNFTTVARQVRREYGHLAPSATTPLMWGALVARWRRELRPNTAKTYLNVLKKIVGILAAHGAPPTQLPRLPRPKQRATVATVDELTRLLKEPPPYLRLFMLLYFQCGLRFSEALRVTPRSWNHLEQSVTVKTKGGATRTVTITPDVEALLVSAGDPQPDTPYIHTLRGKHITDQTLRHAWQRHRQSCGVPENITAHDLRRTSATILYNATKDLRLPQQLLGHKDLRSTLAYIAPLATEDARRYQQLLSFEHFKSKEVQ